MARWALFGFLFSALGGVLLLIICLAIAGIALRATIVGSIFGVSLLVLGGLLGLRGFR